VTEITEDYRAFGQARYRVEFTDLGAFAAMIALFLVHYGEGDLYRSTLFDIRIQEDMGVRFFDVAIAQMNRLPGPYSRLNSRALGSLDLIRIVQRLEFFAIGIEKDEVPGSAEAGIDLVGWLRALRSDNQFHERLRFMSKEKTQFDKPQL